MSFAMAQDSKSRMNGSVELRVVGAKVVKK